MTTTDKTIATAAVLIAAAVIYTEPNTDSIQQAVQLALKMLREIKPQLATKEEQP